MLQRCLLLSSLFQLTSLIRYDAVKQRTGYFWHIDSANLNLDYRTDGDRNNNCQRVSSERGRGSQMFYTLGEFGDSRCDAPLTMVKSAAKFIKKVRGDDFDFILWTGDSRPHSPNMMIDNATRYLEEMTYLLKEEFPYSTIYPILGDQDFSPPSQAKPKDESLYLTAAKLWENWLPPTAIDTFKLGGYYRIDMSNRKLELVGINTALYLESNMVTRHNYHHDPAKQWSWLQATLDKARKNHKTVIIFGHAPPGVFEHDWSSPGTHWLQHSHNIRYHRLIEQYSDVVVGQLFGHQNTDTFRVFYNNKRQPISWALMSPGISPISRLEGVREPVLSSPSIRLYKYSIYDGKVLDYSQFSLSLSKTNAEARPVWELHYNFSSYFQTDVITSDSMASLYDRMVNDRDTTDQDSLTARYLMAHTGGMEHPSNCPDPCLRVHLCAIPNVDIGNFMKCLTQANNANIVKVLTLLLLILVVISCH